MREKLEFSRFKQKRAIDLMGDGILKKTPTPITNKYSIFALDSATGVTYITHSSPHFISGHLRLLGRSKG